MCNHAQRHTPRVAGNGSKVVEFEGQAHAEHDKPEQRYDRAFQAEEPRRLQERNHRENQNPVSEGIADKAAECSQCAHGLILIM